MKGLAKTLVSLSCLWPALWLFWAVYLAYSGGENLLGPDPAQSLALQTGQWSIRFLIAALAVTPLRYLLDLPILWQYRRMLGLYALFYVTLHFLVFLMFLLQWQWAELGREVAQRPFITVGFLALLLLVPLGVTSVQYAKRKMGQRWRQLHRLVYVINILAVIHVAWIVRSSLGPVLLYGTLVSLLLAYRVIVRLNPKVKQFSIFRALSGVRTLR